MNLHENHIYDPLEWKTPQIIFVNSMSDLFHKSVTDRFIIEIFKVMNKAYWHCFQVLTKRSKRLLYMNNKLPWSQNIWMGVSVENQDFACRIDHLRKTNAKVKFISAEPLLGPIEFDLTGIDWVIVGGESGPKARPMDPSWTLDIRDQFQKAGVPFFFKQWGGTFKKKTGRKLERRTWDETPDFSLGR